MTHNDFVNSEQSTIMMVVSWVSAGATYIMRMINMETINSGLVMATTVLALVFTIVKIRGQRLDNESKRLDNEKKRRELDDKNGNDGND